MDKYASTTIDPVELIKKYHRSKKRMDQKTERKFLVGKEEEANRKYPTKFLHSEKAETTTKSATNDAFPRYTTSASFRRKPSDDKSQSSATTKRYGHKLAVTERAGEEPWWAELQRKTRWEMLQEEEVEEEEVEEEAESRREERRKKQRQQEEWRRENLKRRKEEELKAEEKRQDEIWWQQQRRESSRRAAQSRVQLDQQRQEEGRRRAGEEDNGSGLEVSTIHLEFMDLISLILMI